MEIKTGLEGLTVPKTIEDTYRADIKEHPEEYEDFTDWWLEKGMELFEPNENIFVDREIAKFFIDMWNHSQLDYDAAGDDNEYQHNISDWFEFEDNGYKYSVCAYGTTYNLNQFIGYKEKIMKRRIKK